MSDPQASSSGRGHRAETAPHRRRLARHCVALARIEVFVARADSPCSTFRARNGVARRGLVATHARTFASGDGARQVGARSSCTRSLGAVSVVVETHGTSAFAAIPAGDGRFLGVDGEGDKLVVAGPGGADLIETGRHAIAWRLPGVLFAAVLAFLLVLLARRLFASAVLPMLVGLVILADGSMFAQARIGMNDILSRRSSSRLGLRRAAHRPRRAPSWSLVRQSCFDSHWREGVGRRAPASESRRSP